MKWNNCSCVCNSPINLVLYIGNTPLWCWELENEESAQDVFANLKEQIIRIDIPMSVVMYNFPLIAIFQNY